MSSAPDDLTRRSGHDLDAAERADYDLDALATCSPAAICMIDGAEINKPLIGMCDWLIKASVDGVGRGAGCSRRTGHDRSGVGPRSASVPSVKTTSPR